MHYGYVTLKLLQIGATGGSVMCAGNSWSSRAKRDAELHSQYGRGQEADEQRNCLCNWACIRVKERFTGGTPGNYMGNLSSFIQDVTKSQPLGANYMYASYSI